jgi:hypothetical protein
MKGQLNVSTPEQYLAALKEPRKGDLTRLDRLIRRAAPKLKPAIGMGMLGYGAYHYKYATGREGDSFRIMLASNASYISMYVSVLRDGAWLAESYKKKLPKAKIGKSCVRFKRLDDLDEAAIVELVSEAQQLAQSQ